MTMLLVERKRKVSGASLGAHVQQPTNPLWATLIVIVLYKTTLVGNPPLMCSLWQTSKFSANSTPADINNYIIKHPYTQKSNCGTPH